MEMKMKMKRMKFIPISGLFIFVVLFHFSFVFGSKATDFQNDDDDDDNDDHDDDDYIIPSVHSDAGMTRGVTDSVRRSSGLDSPLCQLRARCNVEETGPTAEVTMSYSRNCFCDSLCKLYDDCCEDYRPPEGATTAIVNLPRGVATCQRMVDIETGYSIEVYKVSRCPESYDDRNIRKLCEDDVSPATSDRFFKLPVSGNSSQILYRNIYCAICCREGDPIFWKVKLRCSHSVLNVNRTSRLRDFMKAGCPAEFAPVREWGGRPGPPRRCKPAIGRCDRSWRDEATINRCRQATNYVYVGNRIFRNRDCAVCNHVNETYLQCEDFRSAPEMETMEEEAFFEETAAYVVTVDLNRGSAAVTERLNGSSLYVAETRINFPSCLDGRVYDPFTDTCRQVFCQNDWQLSAGGGRCSPRTQNSRTTTAEKRRSRDNELKTDDADNDDDDDDVYGNITADVSVSVTVITSAFTTNKPEPELDSWNALPLSGTFVIFRLDYLQRLVSIIFTLVCVMLLVAFIILYSMYPALRTDYANRYAVCLAVCLVVGHLLFLFVILPNEKFPGSVTCFCLSILIQYAHMAAFFWLSVMSIDIFKRLASSTPATDKDKNNSCLSFCLFSLYAWLIPAVVLTGSCLIAVFRVDGWEQLYGAGGRKDGECFVFGLSQLLLFTLPICLVLVTNFTMYSVAICRLCFEPRSAQQDEAQKIQSGKDKKRFLVCIQLTAVLATTWALAFAALFTRLSLLWYLFIAFDLLQGVTVCLAFLCKRKVWYLFHRRELKIANSNNNKKKKSSQSHSPDGLDNSVELLSSTLPVSCTTVNSRTNSIIRETSI